ncbi:FxLYD domain-containing protein [Desmospora activa]|uniref:Lipoprotein n=1 Tax=Desmospora activa DSM 45169 TaxID=1121389 RepID=A0A2T4Z6V2_9BACL|nr:FxLYD domain-containing protein [Desmospora activa]PTM57600.1 hypothetical protein C8J48_0150 [Desmospora activa DSM 45169]
MKRLWLGVAACALLLGGCGKTSTEDDQMSIGKQLMKKEPPKVKLETDEAVSQAWKEKGKTKAHGALVLKNKGKTPVEVHSVRLDFKDEQGKVLAKEDILAVVPKIVKPGENVHIGATTDLQVSDPDRLETVTPTIEAEPAWKDPANVEAKQVEWKMGQDQMGTVEGSLINSSGEHVTDLFVTASLRDEEGKLLGVVNDYLNVSLKPEEKEAFKLRSGNIPADTIKEVSEVDVQAYPLFREEE